MPGKHLRRGWTTHTSRFVYAEHFKPPQGHDIRMDDYQHGGLNHECCCWNAISLLMAPSCYNLMSWMSVTMSLLHLCRLMLQSLLSDYLERVMQDLGNLICSTVTGMTLTFMMAVWPWWWQQRCYCASLHLIIFGLNKSEWILLSEILTDISTDFILSLILSYFNFLI